jgi:hypothetical protein
VTLSTSLNFRKTSFLKFGYDNTTKFLEFVIRLKETIYLNSFSIDRHTALLVFHLLKFSASLESLVGLFVGLARKEPKATDEASLGKAAWLSRLAENDLIYRL